MATLSLRIFLTEDYRLGAVGGAAGGCGLCSRKKDAARRVVGLDPTNMADFKKLHVWQKAHALTLSVDPASKRIRGSQYTSLRNQIFRAAASIPANIAEGRRQKSEKEFGRFLGIALNSSSELEYHLILARDTNVIPESEFASLVSQTVRVRKMLYALLKRLAEGDSGTKPIPQKSPQPQAAPPTAPGR